MSFLLDYSNWHKNQYRIVEVSWITQVSDYAGSTVVKMRDVVRGVKIPDFPLRSNDLKSQNDRKHARL